MKPPSSGACCAMSLRIEGTSARRCFGYPNTPFERLNRARCGKPIALRLTRDISAAHPRDRGASDFGLERDRPQ